MTRNAMLWTFWLAITSVAAATLLSAMVYGGPVRSVLPVGKTTSGHHQIELACEACHTSPFGGGEVLQKSCVGCHGAELSSARDTHPAKKFTDPRNADRLEKLKADECVTCHREHRHEITQAMGVTLPSDFCFLCHEDIAKERPTHKDVAFNTCASAGCHRFHDNRSLYEDFLVKHGNEPERKLKAYVKLLDGQRAAPSSKALKLEKADAPLGKSSPHVGTDWLASAHARGGVNCSGCHAPASSKTPGAIAAWVDKPAQIICTTCHEPQAKNFVQGRHGMRLAAGMKGEREGLLGLFKDKPLSPMRPELARIPMAPDAHGVELTCNTCHTPHRYEARQAAVEACVGCHNDDHTRAYKQSPHYKLWLAEMTGEGKPGSGVSCATCHMPRLQIEAADGTYPVIVNHNQNDNLRPNEKMVRTVCQDCHGVPFILDSLADRSLIQRNFSGPPAVHVQSIDWVLRRLGREGSK